MATLALLVALACQSVSAQVPDGPVIPPPSGHWVRLGRAFDPSAAIPAPLFENIPGPPILPLRPEFWIVHTRGTPQVMGSEPGLEVIQFDGFGRRVCRELGELLARSIGRPIVIVTHGNGYDHSTAISSAIAIQEAMMRRGALPPDALLIVFDWPSEQIYHNVLRDINEKARRAYVAGYHLARFVETFPTGSRICLIGHSYGSTSVGAALHLLGGGAIDSQANDPPVALPALRPDLQLRAVLLAAAIDHQWFNPGERMDRALPAAEAVLNAHNHRDRALIYYPYSRRSDNHRALGQVGLLARDLEQLGPIAGRLESFDIHPLLGNEHTFLGTVAHPTVARRMAPYTWAAPLP